MSRMLVPATEPQLEFCTLLFVWGLPCPSTLSSFVLTIGFYFILFIYLFFCCCLYFFFNLILFFNFTILYWFCHISKWIRHRFTCVPHPEPSSLLPPHTLPLGRPSAPAPSIQYRASNLDWWLVSYMIIIHWNMWFLFYISQYFLSRYYFSTYLSVSILYFQDSEKWAVSVGGSSSSLGSLMWLQSAGIFTWTGMSKIISPTCWAPQQRMTGSRGGLSSSPTITVQFLFYSIKTSERRTCQNSWVQALELAHHCSSHIL